VKATPPQNWERDGTSQGLDVQVGTEQKSVMEKKSTKGGADGWEKSKFRWRMKREKSKKNI